MPNLIKDPSPPRPENERPEPNLWLQTGSSNYYARKYVAALGKERVACLDTKDRRTAITLKNQLIAQWEGAKLDAKGKVVFDGPAFELLEIMKSMAEPTFLEYEGALRLHLLPFFSGMTLDDIPRHWPRYKAVQRQKNPNRKLKHDQKALRRTYSYAEEIGLITAIPRFRLERRDLVVERQQEFTNEEYELVQREGNPKLALKFETLAKTAARRRTLRHLQWTWFDWEEGLIRVPADFMKMREDQVIALDSTLLRKYRALYEEAHRPPVYVFPHRDDRSRPESATDKGWQRLKKKLGIKKKQHWLRGSAVRRSTRGGVPAPTSRSSASMSEGVFNRVYYDASIADRRNFTETVAESYRDEPKAGSNAVNPGKDEP